MISKTAAAIPDAGSWLKELPLELQIDPSVKKFGNVADLAKSYKEQARMLGSRIPLPGDNAKPEEWGEVWDKLGRPKTAAEYELPPADVMKGITLDPTTMAPILAKSHELGLNKRQLSGMVQAYVEQAAAGQAAATQQFEATKNATMAALTKEWGQASEQNMAITKKAVETFGGPDLMKYLDESGLGNDLRIVKAFYNAGKRTLDSDIHGSGQRLIAGPVEAQEKIRVLETNPENRKILTNRGHPDHKKLVAEREALYNIVYPEDLPGTGA